MTKDIATLGKTKALLREHGLSLKKSLGQNFLIDPAILEQITAVLELTDDDGALEIGPGIGALTEQLAKRAERVVAVEIDVRMVRVLRSLFANDEAVSIIHQDFLEADLEALVAKYFKPGQAITVAANLPYYITTPILLKLVHSPLPFKNIVVMVQKEVAERIAALPGDKSYGSLSIAVQYYAEASTVLEVPKTAFLPNPNVDSAVLKLKMRREPAIQVTDQDFYFKVVRNAFMQRRKTIFNNLSRNLLTGIDKAKLTECFERCDIDPKRRAETLSLQEFAALSEQLRHIAHI